MMPEHYSTKFKFIDIYGRGDYPEIGKPIIAYCPDRFADMQCFYDGEDFYLVDYESGEFAEHKRIENFYGSWFYKEDKAESL